MKQKRKWLTIITIISTALFMVIAIVELVIILNDNDPTLIEMLISWFNDRWPK